VTQNDNEDEKPTAAESGDGLERELSRVLRPALEPQPDLSDLFGSVQAQIAGEHGTVAWLQSRRTALRACFALAETILPVALTACFWLRPDIDAYPAGRMVAALSAMAALLGAGVWLVLRPLHRPPLPAWAGPVAIAAAVIGLLALSLLPPPHPALQPDGMGALLSGARRCLVAGLLLGSGVFFALRALDRGGARRAALRAVAAGLCANLVLQLHCPNTAPAHIVLGHFAVLAVLLVFAAFWPRRA
jgi:hypothetical protein